jgi:hypothetical protein
MLHAIKKPFVSEHMLRNPCNSNNLYVVVILNLVLKWVTFHLENSTFYELPGHDPG